MKKPHIRIVQMAVLCCAGLVLGAQNFDLDNRRQVTIDNRQDSFFLSVLTILPATVRCVDTQADTLLSLDQYDISGQYFVWRGNGPYRYRSDVSVIRVTFRVMPVELDKWVSRYDSLLYRDGSMRVMGSIAAASYVMQQSPFRQSGLQYDGSFSRGFSTGNRQNLSLNSNFDLRLSGTLGEGIEVLAALSDNSMPLQPEGNTQQLQEFDRVFIQLSRNNTKLTAGDFELTRPNSHFSNYFKKTQGVQLSQQSKLANGHQLLVKAAAGASRGKFARIALPTAEGNQGPYRLSGIDGERFIIVLAGSESIYLDGMLLTRGLEKDYVIDYNTGEITFTANRLITKDVRITAEYEYAEQNYNRSLFTFESAYQTRNTEWRFSAYSEQDSRLTTGLNTITPTDKRLLADLGDNIGQQLIPSARVREGGYDPNIVMYRKVDTLGHTGILVRSHDRDSAKYSARFTYVGLGQGDYIRSAHEDNDEVYIWVAPDPLAGRLGTHVAKIQMQAPQQRQLLTAGGTISIRDGEISSEIAMSRHDLNRFSTLDREDNAGIGWMNSFQKTFYLQSDTVRQRWQINTSLQHEYLSSHFQPLIPYRDIEFARDWVTQDLDQGAEHLLSAAIELLKPGTLELSYRHGAYHRSNVYHGRKHIFGLQLQHSGWRIASTADYLRAEAATTSRVFARHRFDLSKSFGPESAWQAGFYFESEKNETRLQQPDTLSRASFYYDLGRFYLRRNVQGLLDLEMSYQKRYDYQPRRYGFGPMAAADDITIRSQWSKSSKSMLNASISLRHLNLDPSAITVSQQGLNYAAKVNHQLQVLKGGLRSTTAYEIGSGQEPKRTFQFIKVDPGQGVYTFIDQNGDGIPQINEFEISPFAELADYVKVTILSNEFIATDNLNFNQSYFVDLRRIVADKESFIARWSDQGSMRVERKTLQGSGVSAWNPFANRPDDTALVATSLQARNVLYFNRSNPTYDLQYEWNDFRNRMILLTGFESRSVRRNLVRGRVNANRQFSTLSTLMHERQLQESEAFQNKNFDIHTNEWQQELTWQPSSAFRLATRYRWSDRRNVGSELLETAQIHDLNLETTISKIAAASLRTHVSMVLIDFRGNANTSLEFAMLDGLKDGTNWLWGTSYDRKMANNVRMTVSYDGRKSASNRIVHLARAQITAFF